MNKLLEESYKSLCKNKNVTRNMVGLIMKKNTFTLRLSDKQLETLRDMAERDDRTVSAIIRRLIDEKTGTVDPKKAERTCVV